MQLGKLAEQGRPPSADEQIGEIAEGGVGGDAAEAVGAAALESDGERGERRGRAGGRLASTRRRRSVERAGHQRRFAARLLIEDEHGLAQFGVAGANSSRSMLACAFWQPRLSTVAPATLGWWM